MDELEELYGEFDIAEAAFAEFEFSVFHGFGHVFQDAAAHGLDVGDEGVALAGLPYQRGDDVAVGAP